MDGTDLVQSYRAMREAVAYARARKGPALVHAKVIRPYSHSHSDDERNYKTAEERELEAARDPIASLTTLLLSEGLATEQELEDDSHARSTREVADAADRALEGAAARARIRRPVCLFAGRRSHIGRLRHARRRRKASPRRW